MKILIAGGGVAALEAAIAARKQDADCEIEILSSESLMPYRRPALSMFLRGTPVTDKSLYLKDEAFFKENNIALRLNTAVSSVAEREVILSDGSRKGFDKLIIATGAAANIPPVAGTEEKSRIYTLRSWADLQKLDERIKAGLTNAVVIGGSVLGMETADALLARGVKVTVAERASRLFNGRLDNDKEQEVLAHLHSIAGLNFITGCAVEAVTADGIKTADGNIFPGEIIIFTAGCTPDVKFAASSGVEIKRGIVVDEQMRTSVKNIYACGDAAQLGEKCFGLFNEARTTGIVAGSNAAGAEKVFEAAVTPIRCYTLGLKLTV